MRQGCIRSGPPDTFALDLSTGAAANKSAVSNSRRDMVPQTHPSSTRRRPRRKRPKQVEMRSTRATQCTSSSPCWATSSACASPTSPPASSSACAPPSAPASPRTGRSRRALRDPAPPPALHRRGREQGGARPRHAGPGHPAGPGDKQDPLPQGYRLCRPALPAHPALAEAGLELPALRLEQRAAPRLPARRALRGGLDRPFLVGALLRRLAGPEDQASPRRRRSGRWRRRRPGSSPPAGADTA
jgi:hypothetical protein